MTGMKVPTTGVLGTTVALGSHVAKGTLPFTGIALGVYLAVGGGLVVLGVAMRLLGRARG